MRHILRNRKLLMGKPSYTPLAVTNKTYASAKVPSTITIGVGVAQWSDLGGIGNLTQASGGAQPVYNLIGQDGQPSLQFDGVNDNLQRVNYSVGAFTRYFVVKTNASNFLFSNGSDYIWTGSGSTFEVTRTPVVTALISGKNLPAGWLNNDKTKIVTWVFDGAHAGHQVYVNGVLKVSTTNGGNSSNPGTGNVTGQTATLMSRGASGYLAGFCSAFIDRDFADSPTQIMKDSIYLIKEHCPNARFDNNGRPILDANQDLTY